MGGSNGYKNYGGTIMRKLIILFTLFTLFGCSKSELPHRMQVGEVYSDCGRPTYMYFYGASSGHDRVKTYSTQAEAITRIKLDLCEPVNITEYPDHGCIIACCQGAL